MKLAPYQCTDINTANKLNEQGIGNNNFSINIYPNLVYISVRNATIHLPMSEFESLARWFLEEQEIKE